MDQDQRCREVTALVDAHHADLYRYAYRLSGSAADAEDLTQQTFLTAHEKIDQLRSADTARAWLYTILRNAFLKTRRARPRVTALPSDLAGEPSGPADRPAELTGDELTRALDELPDEFRLPLVLFYFEEMSYRDIAEALSLPIGTVMSRLSRGKSHLRQRLGEPQSVPPD